jgi:hypothetical protein
MAVNFMFMQHFTKPTVVLQIYSKKIVKLDARTLSSSAFECTEKYFRELNFPSTLAPLTARLDECPPLAGLDYIWAIAIEVWLQHVKVRIEVCASKWW